MIRKSVLMFAASMIAAGLAAPSMQAQALAKRAMNFDDLIGMSRVAEAQISPDGKWVAYRVSVPDKAANRSNNNLWIVPTAGGEARQITRSGRDMRPQWSPDGKWIAFLSSREGGPQVWVIAVSGGEATKLTSISTGADNEKWSPDGKSIAFTSSVYPD